MLASFQQQPLVRKMIKSQVELSVPQTKTTSDLLFQNQRSSYQQYRKQTQQSDEISVQKLFFRTTEPSIQETPGSLYLTRQREEPFITTTSKFQEQKYKQRIDFSNSEHKNSIVELPKFRMVANMYGRSIMSTAKINRRMAESSDSEFFMQQPGLRQMIICNQLFMEDERFLYQFMFVPDLTQPKERFDDFIKCLRNVQKINSKRLYFYLKDGTPVNSHLDIPPIHKTLIYSQNSVYKPFDNPQLDLLEQQCKTYNFLQIKKKQYKNSNSQVDDIIRTLNDGQDKQYNSKELNLQLKNVSLKRQSQRNSLEKLIKPTQLSYINDSNQKQEKTSIQIDKTETQEQNKMELFDNILQLYDQELKKIDFNQNQPDDINQIQFDNENEEMRTKIKQAAILLEPLLNNILNQPPKKEEINNEQFQMNNNMEQKKQSKTQQNFVHKNIKRRISHKFSLQQLLKINRELFIQNIPKLLSSSNFSRYELHNTYILYCALQQITSQRYKYYNINDGVDYQTYRRGIFQIFFQNEFLAQQIFNRIDYNYSGFLNWEEFLRLMMSIKAKTVVEKIDLFISISDSDGNGRLSHDEIFKLAKLCLSHYVQDKGEFLDILCEYYTRLIFQIVDKDVTEEIPFEEIKKAILENKQDSDLLLMFCGADV
ncbi:unnamed protein product [Paramecium sonneborni]|uniref:EF-hand domain-containing protein n=1 Tax=Paramecium sonneborni TaxID=65129 RepID=A0A8S1QRD4_9CILI|nr:unnamed protein product [Paramecium sonneborni]